MKRLKDKYYEPQAGEWVSPRRTGYRLACCDCGLVHRMDFRVKDGKIQFRAFHAKRSTAAIRRKPQKFVRAI